MKLITGSRALSVLYSFLLKYKEEGIYTLILPSNICNDVFFLINYLEIPYSIVDIDINDFCVNKEIVIDLIKTNKRSILVFNHTYGVPSVPYAFFRQIRNISPHLVIIDDRCLCTPTMKTNNDDNCIDLILYSTAHAKQVDLSGWGFGFVSDSLCLEKHQVTFEKQKYSELKSSFNDPILNYFPDRDKISECIEVSDGVDIDPSHYEKLIEEDVEKWREHKRMIAEIYKTSLPEEVQLPSEMNNWRFNIRVKKKDQILKELFRNNLFASGHFASIGTMLNTHECKAANHLHQNIINLFVDKYYTREKAEKTVELIKKNLA
jgi:hypothetical protein